MALFEIGSRRAPARQIGGGGAMVFFAAFALWAVVFYSGAWPWLGYAWLKRDSFGAGPIGVIGENQAGTNFGISSFLFLKGQEIVIDYDVDIRAGSLWFYVYEPLKTGLGAGTSHYVTATGPGTWTYRVPRTGLYKILIEPSNAKGAGRGFDMSYAVWWGARSAS